MSGQLGFSNEILVIIILLTILVYFGVVTVQVIYVETIKQMTPEELGTHTRVGELVLFLSYIFHIYAALIMPMLTSSKIYKIFYLPVCGVKILL